LNATEEHLNALREKHPALVIPLKSIQDEQLVQDVSGIMSAAQKHGVEKKVAAKMLKLLDATINRDLSASFTTCSLSNARFKSVTLIKKPDFALTRHFIDALFTHSLEHDPLPPLNDFLHVLNARPEIAFSPAGAKRVARLLCATRSCRPEAGKRMAQKLASALHSNTFGRHLVPALLEVEAHANAGSNPLAVFGLLEDYAITAKSSLERRQTYRLGSNWEDEFREKLKRVRQQRDPLVRAANNLRIYANAAEFEEIGPDVLEHVSATFESENKDNVGYWSIVDRYSNSALRKLREATARKNNGRQNAK